MKPSHTQVPRERIGSRMLMLTGTGLLVFWLASFFTTFLPLAAEYRAAYSDWSKQTVWIGAILMGLILCGCISFLYLRFYKKIPGRKPIPKVLLVTAGILVVALLAIDLPMMLNSEQKLLQYFLVGVMFNTVRFLLAGLAIGLVDQQLRRRKNCQIKPE
jgi:hypothetical protein